MLKLLYYIMEIIIKYKYYENSYNLFYYLMYYNNFIKSLPYISELDICYNNV